MVRSLLFGLAVTALATMSVAADDWPRFRGPDGNAVAKDSDSLPTAWSPSANVAWKTELPGPGASSPIIVDGKVFVTCYSGYGLSQESPGEIEDLVRHLVCVDLKSGKLLWTADVPVSLPEDPYTGIGVTAHGYASHTPVSDGENVYAFFGKGGVHAFDMDGNKLWSKEVGKESDPAKWGSSSSPVVFGDTVIVTASAESQAIVGLDKKSGKEVWRQEAKGLDNMWGTPTLVEINGDRTDLVMCVAGEMWGLDPSSGKLRWYADATGAQQAQTSVVRDGKKVFAVTGRGGGSIAIEAGGEGNVSETNTLWTGRDTAGFASPVKHGSKLYVVANGIVTAMDAKSGERVEQVRLQGAQRGGGRFGSLDYPSPVVVGDRMFYLNGSGQMFVFQLGDELKQVRINRVTQEPETFWGTPAISDNHLVMRSNKHLYCVTDKGEQVSDNENELAQADPEPPAADRGGRPGGARGGGRPAGGQFDPMAMFNRMDTDSDGKVTAAELEGNRMADRLMTLDKDDDKAISSDEFRDGIGGLFRRGGNRGGSGGGDAGGRGNRGGGGYGDRGGSNKPDRPQRPEMVDG